MLYLEIIQSGNFWKVINTERTFSNRKGQELPETLGIFSTRKEAVLYCNDKRRLF